jgi:hypothetical protein
VAAGVLGCAYWQETMSEASKTAVSATFIIAKIYLSYYRGTLRIIDMI